jgi:hypothetical protein
VRKLRKLVGLPTSDRRLLLKASTVLCVVRIGLWTLPFARVRRLLAKTASEGSQPNGGPSVDRVTWAVSTAARYVPRSSCLVQALTIKRLLAGLGHEAELHIGVAKDDKGHLEAHAWVEREGKILLGGLPDLSRYTPLPPLPAELH